MVDRLAAIREAVPAIEAARAYGLEFDRSGRRARCPWHSPDKHPSLSFKGQSCKCFACGGGGSSLDLVMALFGLDLKGAAAKLNEDFRLGLDLATPAPAAQVRQASADRELAGRLEAWMRRTWCSLCDYRLSLLARADRFGGVTVENCDSLRVVVEDLPRVERLLDEHYETWGNGLDAVLEYYLAYWKEVRVLVRNSEKCTGGGRNSRGT